jgi:hypothetical protein
MTNHELAPPTDCVDWLASLKQRIAFPAMKGLSRCNLKYMRAFATGHNP